MTTPVAGTGNHTNLLVASTGNKIDPENWVARLPRRAVLHRMETADSLEDRLYWALILWSICGPQVSPSVVVRENDGRIRRDTDDNPIPARQQDLIALLGLAPGMKAHVSRALQRIIEKKTFRREGGVLYFEKAPPIPPRKSKLVASTGNWHVAGLVVSTGNLPDDPVARTEVENWLNELSTDWKNDHKTLKTGYRKLLRQGLSARGILISLEERDEKKRESSSSEPNHSGEPTTTPPDSLPQLTPFHEAHVAVWQAAGKQDVPTEQQSARVEAALNGRSEEFLRWLAPKLGRIRHPGVLPSTVKEFMQTKPAAPPPEPAKCWNCDGSLEGGSSDGLCWPCHDKREALQAEEAQS